MTGLLDKRWMIILGLTVLASGLSGCGKKQKSDAPAVRIGWQISSVIQGQLVLALQQTDILDRYPLRIEFIGFSNGDSMNAASIAGNVDVVLIEDQDAALLLSAGGGWTIISRLLNSRSAIYVPPDSPIKTTKELKGKRVAIPFNTAAQREALKAINKAGLNPQKDIRYVNLDINQQDSVIKQGSRSEWGQIEAMASSDPTAAILEVNGKARTIHAGKVISLILVANTFKDAHPEIIPSILETFMDAYLFYAANSELISQWLREELNLTLDPEVLRLCASAEPNRRAMMKGHVSLNLPERDIVILQEAADFTFDQGLVKARVNMREYVDLSFLRQAEKEWWERRDNEPEIRHSEEK